MYAGVISTYIPYYNRYKNVCFGYTFLFSFFYFPFFFLSTDTASRQRRRGDSRLTCEHAKSHRPRFAWSFGPWNAQRGSHTVTRTAHLPRAPGGGHRVLVAPSYYVIIFSLDFPSLRPSLFPIVYRLLNFPSSPAPGPFFAYDRHRVCGYATGEFFFSNIT